MNSETLKIQKNVSNAFNIKSLKEKLFSFIDGSLDDLAINYSSIT